MTKMRLLDTFAGIGGFHLGVQQACIDKGIDFECVGAIEFDKNARQTYATNFPGVNMFDEWGGDITKIPLDQIPDHDLLTGGFPCQPFSMAGRAYKNNMTVVDDDGRSTLFQNLIDILEYKQPKFFIFENVKGILNLTNGSGAKVVDIITKAIDNVGYNVMVKSISAHEVGVPQKRERVFFIGVLKPNTIDDFTIADNCKTLSSVLVQSVDDKYYLKNIDVWNSNGKIIQKPRIDILRESFISRQSKGLHQTSTIKPVLSAEVLNDTPSGKSRQTDRAYSVDGLCPTLTTVNAKIIYDGIDFRHLTERECARLQGFPDSFKIMFGNRKDYKLFGNAVCVAVVSRIAIEVLE